jgi:hypothetical protein
MMANRSDRRFPNLPASTAIIGRWSDREKTRGLSIMARSTCLLYREAGYMSATGVANHTDTLRRGLGPYMDAGESAASSSVRWNSKRQRRRRRRT